ncbi:hypothetical protein ES703_78660 [subsurface metagenome]
MQGLPSSSTIIWIAVSILVGVAGLIAKEIFRTFRYRHHLKNNNNHQKEIKETLDTIKTESGTISKDLVRTGRDVLKIAGTLKGFDERCKAHLKTQEDINNKVNDTIKTLNGRVFDIAAKNKKKS